MPNLKPLVTLLHLSLTGWAIPAQALEMGGLEFTGSGFLTLAAGKIISGSNHDPGHGKGYDGPSITVDYANNSTYEQGNGWDLAPNSKLGLQGTARLNERFALTGQAVARGAHKGKINLEWLYADIKLGDETALQVGRKRLPLFYYSETQDVGLTYPWAHLPQGLYGWEIVNYNGANLMWRDQWHNWSAQINLFTGSETREDNPFWEYYNGKNTRTDSRWPGIYGMELSLSKDWLDSRLVYITSGIQNKAVSNGATTFQPSPTPRQHLYGLAVNADHENWVWRSELYYIDRREADEEDTGYMFGLGYRWGAWLPMLTYTRYNQYLRAPTYAPNNAERYANLALSLRWDLTHDQALKLQIERWLDHSLPGYRSSTPFAGANLVTLSYDTVF